MGYEDGQKGFAHFLRFYRGEHSKLATRRIHVFGTSVTLMCTVGALYLGSWRLWAAGTVFGYFCAWVSHFFIELNMPATFKYPVYSLMGDLVLWWEAVTGALGFVTGTGGSSKTK